MRPLVKLLIGAVVAASVAAGAGRAVSAAGPTLTLKTASGPPTTKLVVKGAGFGVTEGVDVYFDSTDMALASSDATGAFSVSFHVPASAQPGVHYVTAVGRTSSLSAQKRFTVRTNWTELGFNAARQGWNPYENTLNPYNVQNLEQAWTFPTGGAVNSTPAVVNGILYAGSEDGHIYALHAATGKVKWNDDLSALEPSGFDSSPVVAGSRLYIGGNSGNVYAVDTSDGFTPWVFPTGGAVVSSPTVVNGVVYVGSEDHTVYAINASTGAQIWATATTGAISSSPAVANGAVYAGSANGNVYALSATDGSLLWYYPTGGPVYLSPAVANGVVYIGSYDDYLYALGAADGQQLYRFNTGGPPVGSPAVTGGAVYVGGGGSYAFDAVSATSSAQLWGAGLCDAGVVAQPSVANGVVYETCGDAFGDPGTGQNTLNALDEFDRLGALDRQQRRAVADIPRRGQRLGLRGIHGPLHLRVHAPDPAGCRRAAGRCHTASRPIAAGFVATAATTQGDHGNEPETTDPAGLPAAGGARRLQLVHQQQRHPNPSHQL